MSLRFLHTTDIHLLRLRGTMPWQYFGKRITGRINLALRRGRKHDGARFDDMMRRAAELSIDRLVVTGDLTNLSLDSEFELCVEKLAALDVPCTVIPGNHDVYTPDAERRQRFEHFLSGFMDGERLDDAAYPFIQRFDKVALIGVSTAVATRPFSATGVIGDSQLERLGRMLEQTRGEGMQRIVLMHHPPLRELSKPNHRLDDIDAFAAVIAEHGAELILHGHEHVRTDAELPGPDGPVLVHGMTSGTSLSDKPNRRAGFSIYEASTAGISRDVYEWNGNDYLRTS